MNILPSIEDPNLYGWVVLAIVFATALLSAIGVFVWAAFFRKKPRHKIRQRHSDSTASPAVDRNNGGPSAVIRENAPGEPNS